MHIEFTSTEVEERSGVANQGTDKERAWKMRSQKCLMWLQGDEYPEKAVWNLDENEPPYDVGNYVIHDSSYQVDRNKKIELSPWNRRLTPVNIAEKKKAS